VPAFGGTSWADSQARQKRIAFLLDAPGLPDELVGDCTRLEQILTNLLSNAIKFTSEGRPLSLGVSLNRTPQRDTPGASEVAPRPIARGWLLADSWVSRAGASARVGRRPTNSASRSAQPSRKPNAPSERPQADVASWNAEAPSTNSTPTATPARQIAKPAEACALLSWA